MINGKKVDEQGHVNEYNVTTGRSAALSLTVRLGEKKSIELGLLSRNSMVIKIAL